MERISSSLQIVEQHAMLPNPMCIMMNNDNMRHMLIISVESGIVRHNDLYSSAITAGISGKQKEPSLTALFVIIVIKYLI